MGFFNALRNVPWKQYQGAQWRLNFIRSGLNFNAATQIYTHQSSIKWSGFFVAWNMAIAPKESKMEKVTEFTSNFLDGSIKQEEIDLFVSHLKNGELDHELNEIQQMIEDQLSYVNPLKMKKQSEFHKLGHHNQRVLNSLNNLKSSKDVKQSLSDFKAIFA